MDGPANEDVAAPALDSMLPSGVRPGLIWGYDFTPHGPVEVARCDAPHTGGLRWLHLSLSDNGTRHWIEQAPLPPAIRDMLLSRDTYQSAVIEGGVVGCVLQDFEQDFDKEDSGRIGALRIALAGDLIVTTRPRPLRSLDIARQRIARGLHLASSAAVLDLVVGAIAESIGRIGRTLGSDMEQAEDALLDDRRPPTSRDLIGIRRRLAQIHRLLGGMWDVFKRLEEDEELPEPLRPTVEKLSQRLQSLDGDILGVIAQLRLLREELDIREAQRTNQNLYILSIMTALMLPATFVTGLFGMNTGGMPLQTGLSGTFFATMLAAGAALATYMLLRYLGFMRR
ncbi:MULTISPECIES: CorA family divalent cation transporter [Sphingomonas]|uniref:CorA family divalent cation transporter n=1 Tax=Sphingomonas TaxID=13687 RepID=UPI000B2A906B|nr:MULTISPECIES: CorA family divalent cation transporter [Sphingomonas]